MFNALLLAMFLASPAASVEFSVGSDLVSHAVTIEGTASLEVTADTCNAVFPVVTSGATSEEALAKLDGARKTFESAVRTIIGAGGEMTFGPARVRRVKREKESGWEAVQDATASFTDFPKDAEDFNDHLAKITASVAASGVTGGAAAPEITFEITNPQAVESRLAARAIEDARDRAAVVSKLLNRGLHVVLSGHFPTEVSVGGRAYRFTDPATPVVGVDLKMVLTYTVKLAFELEI